MKRFAPLLVSLALLSAVLAGAFHRHVSHDGGLAPEHVDCVVCAWAPKGHTPSTQAGTASFGPNCGAGFIVLAEKSLRGFSARSHFRSRAPPTL